MLVIRYFRVGKKNQPFFKIVVTPKTNPPKAGRFVEQVGSFDPRSKKNILNADRIKYWLSVGAKPSPRVYNLILTEKILEGKKIAVHRKKKGAVLTEPAAAPKAEVKEAPAEQTEQK